jgi:predicted enzyme involved in methoxymalonyl-ACP biosynthesis
LRRRLLIDVHAGAYGQYRQDLLDPTSSLHQFAPQAMLFSLTAREAIVSVPLTAAVAEVDETIARIIDQLRSFWRKACEICNAAIILEPPEPAISLR